MEQYTNEFTAGLAASFRQPLFSPERLAGMDEEARAIIAEQEEHHRLHPVNAIYRIAVDGSLTRDGGVLLVDCCEFSFESADGKHLQVGQTGDKVVYPDGTTATVITGAGKSSHFDNGRSIALVGSRLSNGDEIISTPQRTSLIGVREGIPMAEDFLIKATDNE